MYSDVIAAQIAAMGSVAGINSVISYEPRSVTAAPLAYPTLVGLTRDHSGNAVHVTYRTRWRVLIPFGEDASAEADLWAFVNSVPAALEDLGTLGTEVLTGFFDLAGRTFRALDLTLESEEWLAPGTG